MKGFRRSFTAILLAAVLILSLPLAASGDDDDDEKPKTSNPTRSCQTNIKHF